MTSEMLPFHLERVPKTTQYPKYSRDELETRKKNCLVLGHHFLCFLTLKCFDFLIHYREYAFMIFAESLKCLIKNKNNSSG